MMQRGRRNLCRVSLVEVFFEFLVEVVFHRRVAIVDLVATILVTPYSLWLMPTFLLEMTPMPSR
jgi:hypothetical protein